MTPELTRLLELNAKQRQSSLTPDEQREQVALRRSPDIQTWVRELATRTKPVLYSPRD